MINLCPDETNCNQSVQNHYESETSDDETSEKITLELEVIDEFLKGLRDIYNLLHEDVKRQKNQKLKNKAR
jgi:hypothetical protein